MWWLYPRAVCYAIATTWTFQVIKGLIVFIAHIPEYVGYSIDDFRWSCLTEHPKQFLRTVRSEKKRLEEYHLSKSKTE